MKFFCTLKNIVRFLFLKNYNIHGRTFRHNKRFQVNAILLLRDTRKKKLTRWNNLEKKFTCDPATIILEFCGPDYDQTISNRTYTSRGMVLLFFLFFFKLVILAIQKTWDFVLTIDKVFANLLTTA